jgi:hypothetical protein
MSHAKRTLTFPDGDKKWKHIMKIQLQLIQNDKEIGKMHIKDITPITHNSNYMWLKCSFSAKSDEQETKEFQLIRYR